MKGTTNFLRAISIVAFAVAVLSLARSEAPVVSAEQIAPDEITVSVVVTTKDGSPVSNLSREDFQILEGKAPAQVTSFLDQSVPSSVAIVFDLSASVGGLKGRKPREKLISAVEQTARLIDSGNSLNEYFIIGFNNDPQLLANGTREDAKSGINRLRSFSLSGQSEFFDTCRFAVYQVTQGKYAKKAVILISDGVDTYSHLTLEDVRRVLKEKGVVIYALDIGDTQDSSYAATAVGGKVLEKLSDDSGGLTVHPKKPNDVAAALERIADNLNKHYVVGFKPTKVLEHGKCYSFKVILTSSRNTSVQAPALSVRNRQSHCPVPR